MVKGWPLSVFNALLAYISAAYLTNYCSKKTDKLQQSSGPRDSGQPYAPPQAPEPPALGKVAGTYDPYYLTLANVQGDLYGDDKNTAPAPAIEAGESGMAGTYAPNYQTLANVQGDVFGADKKNAPAGGGGGGGAAPPPGIMPGAGGMAGTFDSDYQTLAGMNADLKVMSN